MTIAGLAIAEGRVREKRNWIPLALFNSNPKGTFEPPLRRRGHTVGTGCLLLILHCVARLTGQICLVSDELIAHFVSPASEKGVGLSST